MSIPEAQGKVLTDLAQSGDEAAKAWSGDLGLKPQPETTGDEKEQTNGAAAVAEDAAAKDGDVGAKAAATTDDAGDAEKAKAGVDAGRDGAGGGDKKPSIYAEVRRLKQERRELRMERDESRKREETLNQRLAALEAQSKTAVDGSKAPKTEEDLLSKLLTDPKAVLAERDKGLLDSVREAIRDEQKKIRVAETRRQEQSSAIKTLESIKDFDLDRDEEKVFELMEEEYGLDEDDVAHMLATRPGKTAAWIKRAWEKKFSLAVSDQVKADKAAARTQATAGSGKTHSKTTMETLNARAKGAKTKEELEAVWEEAAKILS